MTRPNPLQWIWYTFGGTLGPRYREWVLHDTTGRTRWLRQLIRAVVQVSPLAVVVGFALGDNVIAWGGVLCGLLLALFYSLVFANQTAEHRLIKQGYPAGTAERIFHDRANSAEQVRRYMQSYRQDSAGLSRETE